MTIFCRDKERQSAGY